MKKIVGLLLGLLLLLALPITAFADTDDTELLPQSEDGERSAIAGPEPNVEVPEDEPMPNTAPEPGERATAEQQPDAGFQALFESWMNDGYPDDVGGVYYDDETGRHVIELVALDEGRMEEIRSFLSEPGSVDFARSTYSHNELQAIQDQIVENDLDGERVYGLGIGWTTIDGEITGFGPSGKESRVVVMVDDSVLDEYVEKYRALYGEMVYVEGGGPIIPQDDAALEELVQLTPIIVALFLVAAGLALWRAAAVQTTGGKVLTLGVPVSRSQVVLAVRESGIPPAEDLYERIRNSL